MTLADQAVIDEALRLVHDAEQEGIILRILGSTAVRLHSDGYAEHFTKLGRPMTDIDFMAYSASSRDVPGFIERYGYKADPEVLALFGGERQIYDHPETGLHIDVFFDRLSFCHRIDFRGRLHLDKPTITLADIVLEKLQIVKMAEKDLVDLSILLVEHDLGQHDDEQVNVDRIAGLLAEDWGFYYTSMMNLDKLQAFAQQTQTFSEAERARISARVQALRQQIEQTPKPVKWKLRAAIGPRVKWYTDVDEVKR